LLIIKESKCQGPDKRKLQVKSVEKMEFSWPIKIDIVRAKIKDHKNLEQKPTKEKKNRCKARSSQKKYKRQKRKGVLRNQNVKVKVQDFILITNTFI